MATPLEPRNQRDVPDSEVLTQFGTVLRGFPDQPRWDREVELSTLSGSWLPTEICEAIRPRPRMSCRHQPPDGDRARWTTAGTLRAAGFTVAQSGHRLEHVSIGRPEAMVGSWPAAVVDAFNDCFTEDVVMPTDNDEVEGEDDG